MTIQNVLPILLESIKVELSSILGEYLISLFVMGSVARGNIKTIIQDVDFVLVVRDEIKCAQLERLAVILDALCANFSKNYPDTAFFWISLDGPWEPQPRKEYNIGIHMAVLGLSHLQKRAYYQSNLAMSMYPKCKLLTGVHPVNIVNINKFEPYQALINWISVVWLKYMFITAYFFFKLGVLPDFAFQSLLEYCLTSSSLNFDFANGLKPESSDESLLNFLRKYSNTQKLREPTEILHDLGDDNIFNLIGYLTKMIKLLEDI